MLVSSFGTIASNNEETILYNNVSWDTSSWNNTSVYMWYVTGYGGQLGALSYLSVKKVGSNLILAPVAATNIMTFSVGANAGNRYGDSSDYYAINSYSRIIVRFSDNSTQTIYDCPTSQLRSYELTSTGQNLSTLTVDIGDKTPISIEGELGYSVWAVNSGGGGRVSDADVTTNPQTLVVST